MKRYDFNNILSSKTAPSVVEKFDVNIQLYSTEICMSYLVLQNMPINLGQGILNMMALCNHKPF